MASKISVASKASVNMKPMAMPALAWAHGKIFEMLVQPGEKFYIFGVKPATGAPVFLRIADAHSGSPLSDVTAGNLVYDMMKEAYFRKLSVQVAYRDFGPDPQAGINKLCIDRVILTQ
jgi:hypothetical protein